MTDGEATAPTKVIRDVHLHASGDACLRQPAAKMGVTRRGLVSTARSVRHAPAATRPSPEASA